MARSHQNAQEAQMAVVPKRSDERVRRNLADPITKIGSVGKAVAPELSIRFPHRLTYDLYESMKTSAQAVFYEDSDWAYAQVVFHFLDEQLKSQKPSAMMVATLNSMMTSLLLTEGERRRVRIEVERGQTNDVVADVAQMFRDRMEKPAS